MKPVYAFLKNGIMVTSQKTANYDQNKEIS